MSHQEQWTAATSPFPSIVAGPEDGEVVVLLHGFPQTKAAWGPVVTRLAERGLRAVAFDQAGYRADGSSAGRDRLRLPALVADVLEVADGMGADRFHVVGHDWGGMVAWALAADHADRVASVTVGATPHPKAYLRSMAGTQALRSMYAAAFQVPVLPEVVLRAAGGALLRRMLVSSGLAMPYADEYVAAMLQRGVLEAAISWYRANGPRELLAIGSSQVPTLYVWPSDDVALGRSAAERTAANVDAPYRFEIVENASHWLPEMHADRFTALLLEHLGAHPAPHPTSGCGAA
jgi:pimeloyl-ACP methyl ester carboxylesterase